MPVVIDWEYVEKMAVAGCSGLEIAAQLGCDKNTLYNHCEKEFKKKWTEWRQEKKGKGDAILRAKQFELALKGDRAMLVWLGKNRLNQTETSKIDHSSKGEKINVVLNIDTEDLKNSPIE